MTAEKKSKNKAASKKVAREQLAAPQTPPDETPNWHEQAAFHLTLHNAPQNSGETIWQTHAYHNETGGEFVHPGVLTHDVLDWMRERAGLPAATREAASPPAPNTAASAVPPASAEAGEGELRLSVGELQVEELPVEQEVGGDTAAKRLRAQVAFELAGAGAYLATAASAPYLVQILASDPETGQATVVASASRELRPELLAYTEELDFAVPPVGAYQLLANVVLPANDAAAVALGPVLEVVPEPVQA